MPFANERVQHITSGGDDDACGPGAYCVGTPDMEVAIIHNRMVDIIADNSLADIVYLPFVGKFCRMHAYNDEVRVICVFQRS